MISFKNTDDKSVFLNYSFRPLIRAVAPKRFRTPMSPVALAATPVFGNSLGLGAFSDFLVVSLMACGLS